MLLQATELGLGVGGPRLHALQLGDAVAQTFHLGTVVAAEDDVTDGPHRAEDAADPTSDEADGADAQQVDGEDGDGDDDEHGQREAGLARTSGEHDEEPLQAVRREEDPLECLELLVPHDENPVNIG